MSKHGVNVSISSNGLAPTYTIGDFPLLNNNIYPTIPWTNPFDGVSPWAPVEKTPYKGYAQIIFTGGKMDSKKDDSITPEEFVWFCRGFLSAFKDTKDDEIITIIRETLEKVK